MLNLAGSFQQWLKWIAVSVIGMLGYATYLMRQMVHTPSHVLALLIKLRHLQARYLVLETHASNPNVVMKFSFYQIAIRLPLELMPFASTIKRGPRIPISAMLGWLRVI